MESDLLSSESPLFDAISSQDIQMVGDIFHSRLLLTAEQGYFTPNTLFLVTPTKISGIKITAETATERFEEAIQAGRDFADEYGQQPLHYLVHQAMSWMSTRGKRPSEDPDRKEVAITFVAPLLKLSLSRTMPDYMHNLKYWNNRIWWTELHEDLPVKTTHEGSLAVTTTNKKLGHYDTEEENIFVIDNNIMTQAVIGMSPCFPLIHKVGRDSPLRQAIALELLKKQADNVHASLSADN